MLRASCKHYAAHITYTYSASLIVTFSWALAATILLCFYGFDCFIFSYIYIFRSHLAGERAEHGAGGWAAGTWAPHHGGSTKVPLPAAQSASGAGPSLALCHQTHSTGDASSEPMEGEGSGTRHPQGLGKGSYGGVEWPVGPVWPPLWPYPPYSPPSASPILALCPNSALSGHPGTCPAHRPRPSLAPGCHQHMSTLMLAHTKKYTPPGGHKHGGLR